MKKFKLQHKKIDTIIKVMSCANRNSKNVMLSGTIGSGKTTLCSQVADKLSLDFYPISLCQQTTKSDLIGYLDANGNYRTSALREAYEKGGLVLLDEMDASNPNVLSIINNILSNEQFYFPDGLIQKHEDFKCICSMNTNGRGGDIIYTKSNRLDASTLDRFIFISIDIDSELEQKITDNKEWYKRVLKFREVIKTICNDDVIIGSRAMYDGADLLEAGFSQSEVEDMVIYKGIDEDIIESIKAKMNISSEHDKTKRTLNKSKNNEYNIVDGLIELKDENGNNIAYLDLAYCEADNYELAEILKSELDLH